MRERERGREGGKERERGREGEGAREGDEGNCIILLSVSFIAFSTS